MSQQQDSVENDVAAWLGEMTLLDPEEADFYRGLHEGLQVRKDQRGADYYTPLSNLRSAIGYRLEQLRERLRPTG